MTQGSYLLIARGMTVRGTDGDLGTVADVIADESVDVFRGIVLAHGLPLLTSPGFIAAERVVSVVDDVVQVDLGKADVADLLPPAKPGSSAGQAQGT